MPFLPICILSIVVAVVVYWLRWTIYYRPEVMTPKFNENSKHTHRRVKFLKHWHSAHERHRTALHILHHTWGPASAHVIFHICSIFTLIHSIWARSRHQQRILLKWEWRNIYGWLYGCSMAIEDSFFRGFMCLLSSNMKSTSNQITGHKKKNEIMLAARRPSWTGDAALRWCKVNSNSRWNTSTSWIQW